MSRELQEIDCNCNDCYYLVRDIEKYKASTALHEKWQKEYFETQNAKSDKKLKEFQFKNDAYVHYGLCTLNQKQISFIPNTCQVHTQQCFLHRKHNK